MTDNAGVPPVAIVRGCFCRWKRIMQEFACSEELHNILNDGEDVLWEVKPQRLAYVLSGWQASIP